MKIFDMKVNYQVNPLGIDLTHATFSWKVKEAWGSVQDWVRLVVAEDEGFQRVVYDSGRAGLDSCAFVPDVEWKPAVKYYWTIFWISPQIALRGMSGLAGPETPRFSPLRRPTIC